MNLKDLEKLLAEIGDDPNIKIEFKDNSLYVRGIINNVKTMERVNKIHQFISKNMSDADGVTTPIDTDTTVMFNDVEFYDENDGMSVVFENKGSDALTVNITDTGVVLKSGTCQKRIPIVFTPSATPEIRLLNGIYTVKIKKL